MRSQVGHFSPYKETNRTKRIDFHPNSVFPMCFGNTVWVNFLAFAWSLLELLHVVPVPINHYTTQVDPLATTTRQAKIRLKGLSFPFNQYMIFVSVTHFHSFLLQCNSTRTVWALVTHDLYCKNQFLLSFCEHRRLCLPWNLADRILLSSISTFVSDK